MKKNIIFVHGFRGSSLGLEQLASYFNKKNYNIYIPNIPPAGDESLPEYSPRLYARFLARYIKNNKIEKPILVGHSMGSIIIAAMAERHPELLGEKIIFLSPISVRTPWFFKSISPLSVLLPNNLVSYVTTKYLFIPKNKTLFKEALALTKLCGANYCSRKDVFKAATFSTDYAISDFTFGQKSCIISGEKDRIISRKKTDALAKKIDAKTVYLKNSGHLINYEVPEKVAKEIKDFLKN